MDSVPESVKHILSGVHLLDNSGNNFKNCRGSARKTVSFATGKLHTFIRWTSIRKNQVASKVGEFWNGFSRQKVLWGCSGETIQMSCEWPRAVRSSSTRSKSSNESWVNICRTGSLKSGGFKRNLLGGGLAGLLAYTVTYPLDLVKTLVSLHLIPVRDSFIGSMKHIQSKYGWLGLFQGSSALIYVRLKGGGSILGGEVCSVWTLEENTLFFSQKSAEHKTREFFERVCCILGDSHTDLSDRCGEENCSDECGFGKRC